MPFSKTVLRSIGAIVLLDVIAFIHNAIKPLSMLEIVPYAIVMIIILIVGIRSMVKESEGLSPYHPLTLPSPDQVERDKILGDGTRDNPYYQEKDDFMWLFSFNKVHDQVLSEGNLPTTFYFQTDEAVMEVTINKK